VTKGKYLVAANSAATIGFILVACLCPIGAIAVSGAIGAGITTAATAVSVNSVSKKSELVSKMEQD